MNLLTTIIILVLIVLFFSLGYIYEKALFLFFAGGLLIFVAAISYGEGIQTNVVESQTQLITTLDDNSYITDTNYQYLTITNEDIGLQIFGSLSLLLGVFFVFLFLYVLSRNDNQGI